MSIITRIGNRIENPDKLDTNPWSDSPEALLCDYKAEGQKMSIRCPHCLEFVELAKGNKCSCGRAVVIKRHGNWWVQFLDESKHPQKDVTLIRTSKWRMFFARLKIWLITRRNKI